MDKTIDNTISSVKSSILFFALIIITALISPTAFAEDAQEESSTAVFFFDNFSMYLIIIFGIFSFIAYLVVTYITYKGQGFFGPWIIFAVVAILFLFAEFTVDNLVLHRRFVAGVMFLFFMAALFRYWDAIDIGQ